MVAFKTEDIAAAVRSELSVHRDWFGRLVDYEAPGWKLDQVQELVDELEIEVGLADLDEFGELDEVDCEAIITADHAGLWDC